MFDLDEYRIALERFFHDATMAVVSAGDGVLSQVRREHYESMPSSQNTLDNGQVIAAPPVEASSTLSFSVSEGIAGNFDDVHASIAQAAQEFEAQFVPRMLEHLSQLCDATGNVVEIGHETVWEAQLRVLETIDISFDADGNLSLPTMVMSPTQAERIGEPPPGFAERADAIIGRRRDEWMAGRRTRRLPRHGH